MKKLLTACLYLSVALVQRAGLGIAIRNWSEKPISFRISRMGEHISSQPLHVLEPNESLNTESYKAGIEAITIADAGS